MGRFAQALQEHELILGGGSMYERLRRNPQLSYDEHIANATLIYDDTGRRVVMDTHREYIQVAREAGLPMLLMTGTWRVNRRRLAASAVPDRPVNEDHVGVMRELVDAESTIPVYLGGVLGPHGDAYLPTEGLEVEEAHTLHSWQAQRLADAGVDLLLAMTLPALPEARGLVRAMSATGLDYVPSFVVREEGTLLDGTPLAEAIETLDAETDRPPLGYLANCVHPTVLASALRNSPSRVAERFFGIKANTSTKRPEELDGSEDLITQPPAQLAADMAAARAQFDLKYLAGCCGTSTEHMQAIAYATTQS